MKNKQRGSTGLLGFGMGFAVMLGAAVASPGCKGKPSQLCDAECECAPCNKREKKECVIEGNAQKKVADKYDCSVEFDDLISCYLDENDCNDGQFSIDGSGPNRAGQCDSEAADYYECLADASDLNGTQVGPGPGPDGPGPTGPGVGGAGGSPAGVGGSGVGGSAFVTCDCTCDCVDTTICTMPIPVMTVCDPQTTTCTCGALCDQVCVSCSGTFNAGGSCL